MIQHGTVVCICHYCLKMPWHLVFQIYLLSKVSKEHKDNIFLKNGFVSPSNLRPRASSSSSQSERSASPLVMNSTQSLDIMPRFAVAPEEEGEKSRRRTKAHLSPPQMQMQNTSVASAYPPLVDGMVSNLRRIRLRSNSTGTRPSFRRGASRRIAHQLETPEKPRSPSSKVPKSASVSGLSLVITPGRRHRESRCFSTVLSSCISTVWLR